MLKEAKLSVNCCFSSIKIENLMIDRGAYGFIQVRQLLFFIIAAGNQFILYLQKACAEYIIK